MPRQESSGGNIRDESEAVTTTFNEPVVTDEEAQYAATRLWAKRNDGHKPLAATGMYEPRSWQARVSGAGDCPSLSWSALDEYSN